MRMIACVVVAACGAPPVPHETSTPGVWTVVWEGPDRPRRAGVPFLDASAAATTIAAACGEAKRVVGIGVADTAGGARKRAYTEAHRHCHAVRLGAWNARARCRCIDAECVCQAAAHCALMEDR